MDRIEKSIEDAEELSETLSERIRIIALAILGLCWTFIIANLTSNNQNGSGLVDTKILLIPFFLSVLTLFFDFAQYLFNYISIHAHIQKIENYQKHHKQLPDPSDEKYHYGKTYPTLYKIPRKFFWLKAIFIIFPFISFSWIVKMIIFK